MNQTLVAFFSQSGNTRQMAEKIAKMANADCYEIVPQTPYTGSYAAVMDQAKREIGERYCPPLAGTLPDVSGYDTVLLGTPNWWNTIAPPLATFLKSVDLSGKTVAVFCTHGGGGSGRIERAIKALCPNARYLPALSIYGDTVRDEEIHNWLDELSAYHDV